LRQRCDSFTEYKRYMKIGYLYITLLRRNVFITFYMPEYTAADEKKSNPARHYFIGTLNQYRKQYNIVTGSLKDELDYFTIELAQELQKFEVETLYIFFKNFGGKFEKKEQQSIGLEKYRKIMIIALTDIGIPINAIVDISGVPFNGCINEKRRRRKKKHYQRDYRSARFSFEHEDNNINENIKEN
jgi:hypothetical protein